MKNIFQVLLVLVFFGNIGISQTIVEYSFQVEAACGMCTDRIEKVALGKGGAETAVYDLKTKMLTVTIDQDQIAISEVRWEIAQAGHDNGRFIAPEKVYNNLHFCCQYRESDNEEDQKIHDNETNHDQSEDEDHSHIHEIDGYIFEEVGDKKIPLIGANVYLTNSDIGTVTNENGYFLLDNSTAHSEGIEISYIGYEKQSVIVDKNELLDIVLRSGHQLETIEITYRKRTTEISFIKPLNVETITREELCKAACCNLSESFETNPSVDVSYSDAVTGARQIQMLGLAGPYVQIGRELIPDVRAMSSIYGLSMTPGPWIESIQLIKGIGSVVNGFESITGQINVELKKPDAGDVFFLNGYVNNGGRLELNANARRKISEGISTAVLVHGKTMNQAHDRNEDGFTDMPIERDFVLANRWKFKSKGNIVGQVGIKYSSLNHEGGYHDHFSGESPDHQNHWRMNNATNRYEAWGKIGYINQDKPENSLALQMSAVRHNQNSEFGFQDYNAEQNYLMANLIFQRIPNENHIIRTGLSYQLDDITEFVQKSGYYERLESVPGAYFEYTYKKKNKFSVIPGIRADLHNNYGVFVSPRLHAKYNFSDNSVVRVVGGRGFRTASIFAENLGLFSTNRAVIIDADNASNNPYGLEAEVAWNYGINFTHGLTIAEKQLILSLDYYRTDFENQIVVDVENARQISFYNLEGKSYSNSFQAKVEYELIENLDIRMAYRMFDVKTDFRGNANLQKSMVAKHRSFINAAYKTKNDWFFDATLNWNGQKRLPNTTANPVVYQRDEYSPNFFLLNAQIMKRWGKKWDVYLGAENLTNYKQKDAIIGSDDPFGQYFDASIVWAPLFGTNLYLGFRMTIGE